MKSSDQKLLEQLYIEQVLILTENPDIVGDRYDRNDKKYNSFWFFIGDENGYFLRKNVRGTKDSHGNALKDLVLDKVISRKPPYGVIDKESKVTQMRWIKKGFEQNRKIIGEPKSVNYKYAGIIMPKQSDMEGTYISLWEEAPLQTKAFRDLVDFCRKSFEGPLKLDIAGEGARSSTKEI